jgi:uncharacterized protein
MNGRRLDAGELLREERRGRHDRHLLALTGGGYRGLFTAGVLAAFEAEGRAALATRFDMIAGTSIGGILAIGLACSVSAQDLAAFIREHGPAIFQPRQLSFAGFSRSHYGSEGLRRAIEAVLGRERAKRSFAEIPVPLVVCAVHEGSGTPQLFRTDLAAAGRGDRISTLDVALATSAAPTYFPPHRIGDRIYVDGGVIANAPDLVVLTEANRRFGCTLDECHLLSIGTAGGARAGSVGGAPSKIGWIAKHAIVDLIMTAQEALAIDQVYSLRPGTFLRVDASPAAPIGLDDVSQTATEQIINLSHQALQQVRQASVADLRRFVAHSV